MFIWNNLIQEKVQKDDWESIINFGLIAIFYTFGLILEIII